MTRFRLGEVRIRNGVVLLVDPGMLGEWVDGGSFPRAGAPQNDFDEALKVSLPIGGPCYRGHAVAAQVPVDDGALPVYMELDDNGQPLRIVIELAEEVQL